MHRYLYRKKKEEQNSPFGTRNVSILRALPACTIFHSIVFFFVFIKLTLLKSWIFFHSSFFPREKKKENNIVVQRYHGKQTSTWIMKSFINPRHWTQPLYTLLCLNSRPPGRSCPPNSINFSCLTQIIHSTDFWVNLESRSCFREEF